MAVPKRKTSPSKRGMRRANQGLSNIHYVVCAECNAEKLSHLVCQQCGMYNNVRILNMQPSAKEGESEDDA